KRGGNNTNYVSADVFFFFFIDTFSLCCLSYSQTPGLKLSSLHDSWVYKCWPIHWPGSMNC
uniref:Uncharacterized protein n=1 Tax=Spermophilus dauricus TaxID=99837 RepID=A0A8C9PM69_SPEDA